MTLLLLLQGLQGVMQLGGQGLGRQQDEYRQAG